jgi:hypothetical protein
MNDHGMVTVAGRCSVTKTIDRVAQVVVEKGLTIFARIDHAGNMRVSMIRALQQLLLCSLLLGCSGASWQRVEIDAPYEVPKTLTIAIVPGPAPREAVDAMSAALVDELSDHGIKATVVTLSRSPDATVSIVRWDAGSRGLRFLVGFGVGEGNVVATVDSVSVNGIARGWVTGGRYGGRDENSAEAAGKMIAYTLGTGLPAPPAAAADPMQ